MPVIMSSDFEDQLKTNPVIAAAYGRKIFPFANCAVPEHIKCHDCWNPGWGPTLKFEVWRKIEPHPRAYLCEPCMVTRLNRRLTKADLQDTPENYLHEVFDNS